LRYTPGKFFAKDTEPAYNVKKAFNSNLYEMSQTSITSEAIQVTIVQYIALDGSMVYVVTMIAPTSLAKDYVPTFEEIGQSFHLVE